MHRAAVQRVRVTEDDRALCGGGGAHARLERGLAREAGDGDELFPRDGGGRGALGVGRRRGELANLRHRRDGAPTRQAPASPSRRSAPRRRRAGRAPPSSGRSRCAASARRCPSASPLAPIVTRSGMPIEVRVLELHAGALVAVVPQDLDAARLERVVELLAPPSRPPPPCPSVTRCTWYGAIAHRPADAVVVVVLLDRRRHEARDADAVAAHDERLLAAASRRCTSRIPSPSSSTCVPRMKMWPAFDAAVRLKLPRPAVRGRRRPSSRGGSRRPRRAKSRAGSTFFRW